MKKRGNRSEFHFFEVTSYKIHTLIEINIFLGDSTCGQRALYQVGLTGIPIFNVNNNCATGSSALFMANQLVAGGMADCVLALGFEKMQRGSLTSQVIMNIIRLLLLSAAHSKVDQLRTMNLKFNT